MLTPEHDAVGAVFWVKTITSCTLKEEECDPYHVSHSGVRASCQRRMNVYHSAGSEARQPPPQPYESSKADGLAEHARISIDPCPWWRENQTLLQGGLRVPRISARTPRAWHWFVKKEAHRSNRKTSPPRLVCFILLHSSHFMSLSLNEFSPPSSVSRTSTPLRHPKQAINNSSSVHIAPRFSYPKPSVQHPGFFKFPVPISAFPKKLQRTRCNTQPTDRCDAN